MNEDLRVLNKLRRLALKNRDDERRVRFEREIERLWNLENQRAAEAEQNEEQND